MKKKQEKLKVLEKRIEKLEAGMEHISFITGETLKVLSRQQERIEELTDRNSWTPSESYSPKTGRYKKRHHKK